MSNNTFHLNQEQENRMKELMREGETPSEFISKIINLGLYQMEYRMSDSAKATRKAYRAKRNAEIKEAMALYRKAQVEQGSALTTQAPVTTIVHR